MAHYAFLGPGNVVTSVIVGRDEDGSADWEAYYSQRRGSPCKRTSYNTRGGLHVRGGTPYRKNFAGIGFTYDAARDGFIPPQPFPSWTLDEATCQWQAPVQRPASGIYRWEESTLSWVLVG